MITGKTIIAAAAMLACVSSAGAQTVPAVYPGCAVPPGTFNNVWYFDAVNGNDLTGNGSAAAPWKTIQSLIAAGAWGAPRLISIPYWHTLPGIGWHWKNETGPIHPGDAVQLATGNYGDLRWHQSSQTAENGTGWITIMPAPGATPVLSSISMSGTDNWRFTGLKIQAAQAATGGPKPLINVGGDAKFTTGEL